MIGQPPLRGIRVLEFAGLAPAPFAGMLLADAGATVLRVDRPALAASRSGKVEPTADMLARHKSSIAVDLKSSQGIALIKRLAREVDVLIDPFRPGVLERLGLGPDALCAENPRLIYGRMTGFRRDGKYAKMAGHDINYLGVSGALGLLGRKDESPHAPWNILADFAGGGSMLFQGVLLAILSRQTTGKGQVVEANMVDGSSYLSSYPRMAAKTAIGDKPRGQNLLDGGCPWYDTYETKDGKYVAVGALEPQFFRELIKRLGLSGRGWEEKRWDRKKWPELRHTFSWTFKGKTRAEWEKVFEGSDACCTPVFEYKELEGNTAREGDQRPPVTLRRTPLLAVTPGAGDQNPVRFGQGTGVQGAGYTGTYLVPGQGGDETLRNWIGWKRGEDFDLHEGGLVLKQRSSRL